MDKARTLTLYDECVRARPDPAPGFSAVWEGPVLRIVGPDREPHSNTVVLSRLKPATADAAIAREVAFFGREGRSFEWKLFSHDEPADLASRLEAHGFVADPLETLVAFDLAGPFETPALSAGLRIERIEDPERFDVIERVNGAVYGRAVHARWLAAVTAQEKRADPDSLLVYAAFAGDEPVAAGWMRHRRGASFGSLWGGATLADHRGRGVYTALVAARIAEARARGCRILTVDCSPMSLPILERRGFARLAEITPYIRRPDRV